MNTTTKTISHRGPHPGILASVFTALFITGLSFVISFDINSPHFPGPWEPAAMLTDYFRHNGQAVLWCAFFQFCSAIPLGIFTASMVSRINFLGSNAPGNYIALFGGFFTAFNIVLSASIMWVMVYPGIADNENILRTLYYMSFIIGGIGYSVPIGLLIAGIAVTSWFRKTLPRWFVYAGIVLAFVGELSSLFMLSPAFLFAIPVTRFIGFIWLIMAGFKIPKTKLEVRS